MSDPQPGRFTAGDPDTRESRVCRSIIAVLNPAGSTFNIIATAPLGEDDGLVMSYFATTPGGEPMRRSLACRFGKRTLAARARRSLIAATSDGHPLGPARLRFLQRYWLGSPEAETAAGEIRAQNRRP